MRGTMVALLLGGLLTIGVGPAAADVIIYATTTNTTLNVSKLYTVDVTTNTVSSGIVIQDPNTSTNIRNITATAFDNNGVLWALGSSEGGSGNQLYTINPSTGVATPIVGLNANGNVSSMAFAPGTNNLSLMIANGSGMNAKFSLNTVTGLTTQPSNTPVTPTPATPSYSNGGNALAYNPTTGTLYFANGPYFPSMSMNTSLLTLDSNPADGSSYGTGSSLGTVDYTTNFLQPPINGGTGWTVNSPGIRIPGMAFSPDGNTLYAGIIDGNPSNDNLESALAIITGDPAAGSPIIEFTSFLDNEALSSIAIDDFASVPEPGSLALLTAAAAGALGYTWRRRRAASPPIAA